jgi:NADPH:quinone reductase-like Zn-dependent oxidoreductase
MSVTRAAVHERYCTPDDVEVREFDVPAPASGEVLLDVRAASVNPLDWHSLTGTPWLLRIRNGVRRPKQRRLGTDVAGVVIGVGSAVTQWHEGDEVFGVATGSFAAHACAKATSIVAKPPSVSFEDAAAAPIAGLTALQALRDKGRVGDGQRVLVIGAAGGVGTFAVQIAKHLGAAHVTGVCSTANVDMVRAIGADDVVDYTREGVVAATASPYDVIIDNVGDLPLRQCRRLLAGTGVYVIVSGPKRNRVLGPVPRMLAAIASFAATSPRAAPILARVTADDLAVLADLLDGDAIRPVIERTYSLDEVDVALRHIGSGHTRGKIVVVPRTQPVPVPPDRPLPQGRAQRDHGHGVHP